MSIDVLVIGVISIIYIIGYNTYLSGKRIKYEFQRDGKFEDVGREPTKRERRLGLIWPVLALIGMLKILYELIHDFIMGIVKLF